MPREVARSLALDESWPECVKRAWRLANDCATDGDTLTIETYCDRLRRDVSGVKLEPSEVARVEAKTAAGETLSKDELIVADAANRMARPRNRPQRRDPHYRLQASKILFGRPQRKPVRRRSARRGSRPRRAQARRAHATRGAPARPRPEDEPEPLDGGAVA